MDLLKCNLPNLLRKPVSICVCISIHIYFFVCSRDQIQRTRELSFSFYLKLDVPLLPRSLCSQQMRIFSGQHKRAMSTLTLLANSDRHVETIAAKTFLAYYKLYLWVCNNAFDCRCFIVSRNNICRFSTFQIDITQYFF